MQPVPVSRDIVVVGAGIVGCAVAYELARRGASVEVVDTRGVGMGATQAAAGILAPYIGAREDSPLLDLLVRSLALFDELVSSVSRDSGHQIPYKRTGTLEVADAMLDHRLDPLLARTSPRRFGDL